MAFSTVDCPGVNCPQAFLMTLGYPALGDNPHNQSTGASFLAKHLKSITCWDAGSVAVFPSPTPPCLNTSQAPGSKRKTWNSIPFKEIRILTLDRRLQSHCQRAPYESVVGQCELQLTQQSHEAVPRSQGINFFWCSLGHFHECYCCSQSSAISLIMGFIRLISSSQTHNPTQVPG